MAKYKIHITTKDGELLNTIEINTTEKYWDSSPSKTCIMNEIFDEIENDLEGKK